MSTAPTAADGEDRHLRELSPDECWSLAATQPVGRLVWQGATGPCVVPVNFTMVTGGVQVRTSAYSSLARECDDSAVAFEVDSVDAEARTGWSVVLRGHAHVDYGHASAEHPEVWPAGSRALHLLIDVDEVTGRRLG